MEQGKPSEQNKHMQRTSFKESPAVWIHLLCLHTFQIHRLRCHCFFTVARARLKGPCLYTMADSNRKQEGDTHADRQDRAVTFSWTNWIFYQNCTEWATFCSATQTTLNECTTVSCCKLTSGSLTGTVLTSIVRYLARLESLLPLRLIPSF